MAMPWASRRVLGGKGTERMGQIISLCTNVPIMFLRDRLHATHDYQVNLKAELEIRHLHQKLDHLLSHQWERLVEIQEMQMELINEKRGRR
jgi:hypothetical protein